MKKIDSKKGVYQEPVGSVEDNPFSKQYKLYMYDLVPYEVLENSECYRFSRSAFTFLGTSLDNVIEVALGALKEAYPSKKFIIPIDEILSRGEVK